ncbi:DNA recombination and repair protein Rad51 [Macleaya cordata]|uniref:DNA repair protein RAD51 homolog 3 n=1 Tax=Macleaya cordata TaxID=56857 RepID=A0A200R9Z2_MACCD|nr:DNA recombination and repair protein Rad51 [Macleaya cordata]
MEVSSLPLSPTQRAKLISAGYTTLSSLSSLSPPDLARDLNVSHQEAQEILKIALQSGRFDESSDDHRSSHSIVTGAQSAWDMLREEEMFRRITTSCADLDNILGGGINCKEVTEIGGVPGIGKTQLGIQLAVNVQIPVDYGGLGGKAIYIDTEGSFMVERVSQIAEGCIENMLENYVLQRKDFQVCQEKMQLNTFLKNIFYFRICSYTEQVAVINYLDKFIAEHKDVGKA